MRYMECMIDSFGNLCVALEGLKKRCICLVFSRILIPNLLIL